MSSMDTEDVRYKYKNFSSAKLRISHDPYNELAADFNDQLSAVVSGNYQGRGREVSYYHPAKDRFFTSPDSLNYQLEKNKGTSHFPHPDRSMDKYGANLFLDFKANDHVQLSFTGGLQNSEVQNAYSAVSLTSLTTTTSRTACANAAATAASPPHRTATGYTATTLRPE